MKVTHFPPGIEGIWLILGFILYPCIIMTEIYNEHDAAFYASLLSTVISIRLWSIHYWWKYRKTFSELYPKIGDVTFLKVFVRYTDTGFLLSLIICAYPLVNLSVPNALFEVTFCTLFAITVGFWVTMPMYFGSVSAGCWWYNLVGDFANHGPLLFICAMKIGELGEFPFDRFYYPIIWAVLWILFIFARFSL